MISDYVSKLKVLCNKIFNSNSNDIKFTPEDLFIIMIARFVANKEKYIKKVEYHDNVTKKNYSKIEVDFNNVSDGYIKFLLLIPEFVPDVYSNIGVEISNVPDGVDQDKLRNGIKTLQWIRNNICHGDFIIKVDRDFLRRSYIMIGDVKISYTFFDLYVEVVNKFDMDKFRVKDLSYDQKDTSNISELIEEFNARYDDKFNRGNLFGDFVAISNKMINTSQTIAEISTLLDQTTKVALQLGINVEQIVEETRRQYFSLDIVTELEEVNKHTLELELLSNFSKLLGSAIVNKAGAISLFTYVSMLFASKKIITANPPASYGLISTSGLSIDVNTSYNNGTEIVHLRKGKQYIQKVANIIYELNKMNNLEPENFNNFIVEMVTLLANKNSIMFSRIRNGVEHFNLFINDNNGSDELILKDRQKQNDDDSTHFILSGSMSSFYHLINNFDNQNNRDFSLKMLFDELRRTIHSITKDKIQMIYPDMNDFVIENALNNLKNIEQNFELYGVNLDMSVLEFCPELIQSNGLGSI